MLAMQYGFTLPADYDMQWIRQRVADKGSALDQHAPLLCKAYLMAERGGELTASQQNRYAPFYLWREPAGLSEFLCSAGFAGLVSAFGRPSVDVWPGQLGLAQRAGLRQARIASRDRQFIPASGSLSELAETEQQWAVQAVQQQGALLAVSLFEATLWSRMRFALWAEPPQPPEAFGQLDEVLHLSLPAGRV